MRRAPHRDETLRLAVRDMLRGDTSRLAGQTGSTSSAPQSDRSARSTCRRICNRLAPAGCRSASSLDIAREPFHIAVAPTGASYVFNASGQEIVLSGLVCLFDAEGPCANAVRDSQRTKTHEGTTRTLSVIWGVPGHEERLAQTTAWYRELLERAGAETVGWVGRG